MAAPQNYIKILWANYFRNFFAGGGSDPRPPHTRQTYEQTSGQNTTPNASKKGKFGSLGAIFLFIFLPCMWGLGSQKESPLIVSGKKKAHKYKRFGPVALGTTPGLSLGQTGVVPGTNRGFLLILHSGSPVCPWDKPGLSLGQTGGEWRQKKFMCQMFMCLFWPL